MRDELVTDRLRLRRFTAADDVHLFALDNDPEVMRFINGGEPVSVDTIRNDILPLFVGFHKSHPGFGFWLAEHASTHDFLGWLSFRAAADDPRVVELGYRFRRAAWGKGYATEGARALIDHGFAELGVVRVIATTYEHNAPSRRVMDRLGMKLVRTFRITPDDLGSSGTHHTQAVDVWEGDDVEYALDRAAWRGGKS